jgi:hypothetical protein
MTENNNLYIEKYLTQIKTANDSELRDIIDKIYSDGYDDGINDKEND